MPTQDFATREPPPMAGTYSPWFANSVTPFSVTVSNTGRAILNSMMLSVQVDMTGTVELSIDALVTAKVAPPPTGTVLKVTWSLVPSESLSVNVPVIVSVHLTGPSLSVIEPCRRISGRSALPHVAADGALYIHALGMAGALDLPGAIARQKTRWPRACCSISHTASGQWNSEGPLRHPAVARSCR